MRLRIAISCIIVTWCWSLNGQTLTDAVYANPDAHLDLYQSNSKNSVHLTQLGDGNTAQIKQVGDFVSQAQLIRALQEGNANTISMVNNGSSIRTDVYQKGTANQYNAIILGQSNTSLIIQNGNNNIVTQQLNNSSGIRTEFIQNGDNNAVQQSLENIQNQQFKLIQNGNGLRAIIVQRG
jgi:hypothetical protein